MATYYVATTGNDTTGDGSQGNPWLTIDKFFASYTAGDTLYLEDGTYTWAEELTDLAGFTMEAVNLPTDASVTKNGWNVIIDAGGADVRWDVGSGTYVFRGLYFTDNACTLSPFYIPGSGFTYTTTFDRCYFEDLTWRSTAPTLGSGGLWGPPNATSTFELTMTMKGCVFDGCIDGSSTTGSCFIMSTTPDGSTNTITLDNVLFYLPSGVTNPKYICRFGAAGTNTGGTDFYMYNSVVRNASGGGFSLHTQTSFGKDLSTWTTDGNFLNNFTFTDSVTAGASDVENSDSDPGIFISEVAGSENWNIIPNSAAWGIAVQRP